MLFIIGSQKLGNKMIKPQTSDEQALLNECRQTLEGTPLADESCTAIFVDPRTEISLSSSSKPKNKP